MTTAPTIRSTQNERIKRLLLLHDKSAVRRREGLFLVEGQREILQCLHAGYDIRSLYYCPELLPQSEELARLLRSCPSFALSRRVYERVAYRGTTEGIIAEVSAREARLDSLHLSACPLIVVLERVEKPGNLGAILRTADAAGVDAVIVCNPLTDLFNPNLIRASLGAVFTLPCVTTTSTECIAYLRTHNVQILTAQLQDSHPYYSMDFRLPTAIVMGAESTGLTEDWRSAADHHILIPMHGQVDSLNVSTSTAILLFEAIRQRN